MKKTCTADEILELIRRDVEMSSQVALAKVMGVSSVYISDILGGRRLISDRVASHYGFRKETVYNKAS
jgi:plasmid maintenance system antidote protein VapI